MNNIFYSLGPPRFVDGSDTGNPHAYFSMNGGPAASGNDYDYNLYWNVPNAAARAATPPGTVGFEFFNWCTFDTAYATSLDQARSSAAGEVCGWEEHGMQLDPLFADSDPASPDLRLQPGSPAVDAAGATPASWPVSSQHTK
jgi:hypothetical protein